jgi:hypothetical protein
MKRTTIALEDDLLRKLKADAAKQGTTLSGVVNEILRGVVTSRPRPPKYKLDLGGFDGELQPGVDICDRDKLFDLMDGR